MTNFYKLMLGRSNKFARIAFEGGFAGADFGMRVDLEPDFELTKKAFVAKHRMQYENRQKSRNLNKDSDHSPAVVSKALGQLWTISFGAQKDDVLIAPDGNGNYRIGFITTPYFYAPGEILPHRRNVEWEDRIFPSKSIPQDVYSAATGFTGTICDLTKYHQSIVAMLDGVEINLPESSRVPRVGEIPGVLEGKVFKDREELRLAGIHRPPISGISYISNGPAESIVISGGYKDDEDFGNRIIYTGQGGQDSPGGKQVSDQELTRGNRALVYSQERGKPVRVIRGWEGNKEFSPKNGYRYDGLFQVAQNWYEPSKDGPLVIRFELLKCENALPNTSLIDSEPPTGQDSPDRKEVTILKLERESKVRNWVKQIHADRCQFCGITLITRTGTFSEGAHIQGLGGPHYGSDVQENMLCLCPNCHALFDRGALFIASDGKTLVSTITGEKTEIFLHERHKLDLLAIAHHRLYVAGIRETKRKTQPLGETHTK